MLSLIVDDDLDYAAIVEHALRREGHNVAVAHSTRAARSFSAQRRPDLAILDVVLPDGSGLDLCTDLRRQHPDVAVIFLSAKGRPDDVVDGLTRGGDDYVTKPFHPNELMARVSAVTRRAVGHGAHEPSASAVSTVRESLEIDRATGRAAFAGLSLGLTPTELDILEVLAMHRGEVLAHGFLMSRIWGYSNEEGSALLKGHIAALRRKLVEAGSPADLIETVQKVGYRMVASCV